MLESSVEECILEGALEPRCGSEALTELELPWLVVVKLQTSLEFEF